MTDDRDATIAVLRAERDAAIKAKTDAEMDAAQARIDCRKAEAERDAAVLDSNHQCWERVKEIFDVLNKRGCVPSGGAARLGFFHAILDGMTAKLDQDGERIAPSPAPHAEAVTEAIRRMDEFLAWKVSSDVRSEGNDLLRAISAALGTAGRKL